MSSLRILGRNIASNVTGFGVQVVITFFLTPFVLHTLGDARYGVWSLIVGLTGYYGLLDVGFRSGITQYMARYLATGNFAKLNETASTGFVALAACSGIILMASLALGFFAHSIFAFRAEVEREVAWCIWIVGGSVAIQFLFYPFTAVLTATQRFDLANIIGIGTRLLTAGATFASMKAGYGLVGLSLVTAGGNLVDYGLRWQVAYRVLPQLRITLSRANWASCREFANFGLWNFLIDGSQRLISYTHSIIIGLFMPVAAIAPYALASNLRNYFDQLCAPIGQVFFPAAAHLDAQGDWAGLRRMYLGGSRMMLLLGIVLGMVGFFWAEDFFRLWVGSRYTESGEYPSVALIFRLLLVAAICAASQRIGYQVMLGTRRVRELSLLFAAEGGINVILSVLLIQRFGLIGVAIGAMVPAVVFQCGVYPVVLCRVMDISWKTYVGKVLIRPVLVSLVLLMLLPILQLAGSPTNWMFLCIHGLVGMVSGGLVAILLGLNREEKFRFIVRPTRKWLDQLGRLLIFKSSKGGYLQKNQLSAEELHT